MQAPLSTPNAFVYLEFGALPVKYVIQIRQLTFLRHFLGLADHDPVRMTYEGQKLLPYEKNWANEVLPLLQVYQLTEYDIANMSKEAWKHHVKCCFWSTYNSHQGQNQNKIPFLHLLQLPTLHASVQPYAGLPHIQVKVLFGGLQRKP